MINYEQGGNKVHDVGWSLFMGFVIGSQIYNCFLAYPKPNAGLPTLLSKIILTSAIIWFADLRLYNHNPFGASLMALSIVTGVVTILVCDRHYKPQRQ